MRFLQSDSEKSPAEADQLVGGVPILANGSSVAEGEEGEGEYGLDQRQTTAGTDPPDMGTDDVKKLSDGEEDTKTEHEK